jgi:hypothetical protein
VLGGGQVSKAGNDFAERVTIYRSCARTHVSNG